MSLALCIRKLKFEPVAIDTLCSLPSSRQELGSVQFLHCTVCTEKSQWSEGGTLDEPGRPVVVKVPVSSLIQQCPKCGCVCLARSGTRLLRYDHFLYR